MSHFGESVNNHPYGIIPLGRPRKTKNEVHLNNIPLPLRNRTRLQQASWSLMLHLDKATNITLGNIGSNFPLHAGPPE
jgi:hypothetical protein